MKTFSAKPTDVKRTWYLVDAASVPLGRLSTAVASLLLGKTKPDFTKHIDTGDYVIVTNAANLVVTGNKLETKHYYHHSGHPGGLRTRTLSEQLERDPTKVIIHAVRGMLPENKLRDERLKRLKVYPGLDHAHEPQKPVTIDLKVGK